MVRDTVAVETLARLAISRIFILSLPKDPIAAARFLHDCNRPIGKLPDRLRHRTARHFPKNHVRRFFQRTFRFFSSVTSAANDSQPKRVSQLFLDPEPPTLDQPPAHQGRALALRCSNKHWLRTDCLYLPQNRVRSRKRRPQRAKFRRRIAPFLPRKRCCCKNGCFRTSRANPNKAASLPCALALRILCCCRSGYLLRVRQC